MVAKFIRPNIIEDLEVNLSVAKQLAKAFAIKDLSQEFMNIILEESNLELEVYNASLLKKTID